MSSASWLFSRADGASSAVASGLSRVQELQCYRLSNYLQVNGLPETDRVLHDGTRLRDWKRGNLPQTAELTARRAPSLEARKELHKIAPH
jgi:hypothetical protein